MTNQYCYRPSLWQQTAPTYPYFYPLNKQIQADVLVIGGGLCGILTAHALWKKGVTSLAVIDASDFQSGGVTRGTTAKVTAQHGLIYARLAKQQGAAEARLYADVNQAAIDEIEALAVSIPASYFTRCDSTVFTIDPNKIGEIEQEMEACRRAGLPVEYVEQAEELPFPIAAGVKMANQAHMHPLGLMAGLIEQMAAGGVQFYSHTLALPHESGDMPGVVHTADPLSMQKTGSIRTDTVVLANHFPLMDKHGLWFSRIFQERSYAVAIEQVEPIQNIYWGAETGPYSFRPFDFGERKGIILVGCGHKTGHETDRSHFKPLQEAAAQWYPGGQITATWSAQDGVSPDGMPYIGRYKQLDGVLANRVYMAAGFNKWGMTTSMVAANIISDAILGKEHPAARLFSPSRFDPMAKAKDYIVENADMAASLVGGLLKIPQETIDGISPGQGAVVLVDNRKVGVFKDQEGRIHTIHPHCTHMGCVLEFNPDECSWDCPCHGSRFDVEGRVLNNPANRPLEKPKVEI